MKKIGVLGYGSIGKRHVTNLQQLRCDVRFWDPAIHDPSHSGWTRDKLIEQSDALVIASPTSQHVIDINDCCLADKPIFVEKPIGNARFSLTTDHVKMVGYNLRMHSCVKKAKQWLEAGCIGSPYMGHFLCAQFNDKPVYLRDGVILNWSHEIDLALYLLGPATVHSCYASRNEDRANIMIEHSDTCSSLISLDYLTRPEVRGFRIAGDGGHISVDLVRRQAILRPASPAACDVVFNGQDSFDENYKDEMQAFLMRLEGLPTLGCTAQEGLDILDICLKAKEIAQ